MTYESTYNKIPHHRLPIYFNPKYKAEAIKFIDFLKNAGQKHVLDLHYRSEGDGCIRVIINKEQGGHLDTLLQELILSRGLHYYACTLENKNKIQIINEVVLPIYQDLLDGRFHNPYSKYLNHHILARISPNEFVPGDMENEFARGFETLYRKWSLGIVDNDGFILDLDSLMMRFLLTQVGHRDGEKSAEFNVVLSQANRSGIGMHRDYRKVFQKIHTYRTSGLHRLGKSVDQSELTQLATKAFIYFQYFDEFSQAQTTLQIKLHGKLYNRIRYGDEKWLDGNGNPLKNIQGEPYDYEQIADQRPCGDCGAVKGQLHCEDCDMEVCPRCSHQLLACIMLSRCKLESDFDD